MNSLIKIKDKKIQIMFLLTIILGTAFILLSCFHTNIWFDESYTIAIAKHPFTEIWKIGSADVHPVLYYFMVRIVLLVTGGSVLCVRLFSAIPLIIMGILGYTHIRKDFGSKTGIIFTFLSLFFPTCLMYAGEIRMYTWAMLFVTLMAIYAYRILKYRDVKNKNWIIFAIFSLASAYTHYYGLAAAFVINLGLFIYLIVKSIKNKNIKENRYLKNLKRWIISAIIQIIAYLPWAGVVLNFAKSTGGYWIGAPNVSQMIQFQFTGNLGGNMPDAIAWTYTILFILYILYSFKKNWNRDEIKPAKLAILVYFAVILFVGLISILVEPILYARYLLNITGIFIFVIAVLLTIPNIHENQKAETKNSNKGIKLNSNKIILIICSATVLVSLVANITLINKNYDESNAELENYMKANVQEDDIVIADNSLLGLVIGTQIGIDSEHLYFYDIQKWNVEEAYKAYGKTVYSLDQFKDYNGRIWTVNREEEWADYLANELEGKSVITRESFKIKYGNENYVVTLLEKA